MSDEAKRTDGGVDPKVWLRGADETPEAWANRLHEGVRGEAAKVDVLLNQVVTLEDDLANRIMSEFDDVLSDESRKFWRGQILANREEATAALIEFATAKRAAVGGNVRRPLHNRALARPVVSAAAGAGSPSAGSGQGVDGDDRAAKIRNRAHEISRAERVPFSAAFRRAERELAG